MQNQAILIWIKSTKYWNLGKGNFYFLVFSIQLNKGLNESINIEYRVVYDHKTDIILKLKFYLL
jgi:hypothetical protein